MRCEQTRAQCGKRHRRGTMCCAAVAVVVLACLWFAHGTILEQVARLLIVDRQPADCDYLCIRTADGLHPDGDRCYDRAAGLYHQATRRRILLIKPYPCRLVQSGAVLSFESITKRALEARGVPLEVIITIDAAPQTEWEEARLLETWMKEHPQARVLLLCDRFRSRRWRHVLDTVLRPEHAARVGLLPLADRRYDETNWWKSRRGLKRLFERYVCLAFAWCQGETSPTEDPWDPDAYERMLRQTVRNTP